MTELMQSEASKQSADQQHAEAAPRAPWGAEKFSAKNSTASAKVTCTRTSIPETRAMRKDHLMRRDDSAERNAWRASSAPRPDKHLGTRSPRSECARLVS